MNPVPGETREPEVPQGLQAYSQATQREATGPSPDPAAEPRSRSRTPIPAGYWRLQRELATCPIRGRSRTTLPPANPVVPSRTRS